jgi:hypothetical protein
VATIIVSYYYSLPSLKPVVKFNMQQLILLLPSLLLGCGFPAFLIGFYSIRIWESRLRSLSLSFVGSGSSGSGCEKPKSKHKKDRKDRDRDRRRETWDKPGRGKSTSLSSSSVKKIVTRSILGPLSTSVDVVSPSGQTISVSVEGVPPSTIPNVVCPLAKGAADPSVLAPDVSQTPLTNPDSAAPASKNMEIFRGLTELELIKLLEQLQEQVPAPVLSTTSGAPEEASRGTSFQMSSVTEIRNTIRLDTIPPPGFQPRLMLHQQPNSRIFSCGRYRK